MDTARYVYFEDEPGRRMAIASLDQRRGRGGSPITIHPTARRLGSKCIQSSIGTPHFTQERGSFRWF
jgi:hypothetical protein